ncbi:DUF4097 domain-containing protein [Planctomycetota bacterium]
MNTNVFAKQLYGTLLAFILFTGGCFIDGGSGRVKYEKTVELSQNLVPGSSLNATTPSGSITIRGTESQVCHVSATIRTRAGSEAAAQELADQVTVQLTPKPNGLILGVDRPKNLYRKSVSVSYQITVPRQTHITCDSSSGSITLEHLIGNITAETSSGSVRARDLAGGDVDCHTSSGSVSLVHGSNLGTCELATSSGSVKAEQVAAAQSVHLSTSSGSVKGIQITSPRVSAHTSSGGVTVDLTPATPADVDVKATSSSGSVAVTLPPSFAGSIEMGTHSGSVQCDHPVTIQGKFSKKHIYGTIGEGDGQLIAKTNSGSVRVK